MADLDVNFEGVSSVLWIYAYSQDTPKSSGFSYLLESLRIFFLNFQGPAKSLKLNL